MPGGITLPSSRDHNPFQCDFKNDDFNGTKYVGDIAEVSAICRDIKQHNFDGKKIIQYGEMFLEHNYTWFWRDAFFVLNVITVVSELYRMDMAYKY